MLAIYFRQCLSRIQGAGQGMYVLKIGKEHIDGATDGLQQARGLDHQIVAGTVIIVGSLVCLGGIDNLVQIPLDGVDIVPDAAHNDICKLNPCLVCRIGHISSETTRCSGTSYNMDAYKRGFWLHFSLGQSLPVFPSLM